MQVMSPFEYARQNGYLYIGGQQIRQPYREDDWQDLLRQYVGQMVTPTVKEALREIQIGYTDWRRKENDRQEYMKRRTYEFDARPVRFQSLGSLTEQYYSRANNNNPMETIDLKAHKVMTDEELAKFQNQWNEQLRGVGQLRPIVVSAESWRQTYDELMKTSNQKQNNNNGQQVSDTDLPVKGAKGCAVFTSSERPCEIANPVRYTGNDYCINRRQYGISERYLRGTVQLDNSIESKIESTRLSERS